MDTNQNDPAAAAAEAPFNPPPRIPFYREDGWTPEVQEEFIVSLISCGSVQKAADHVDRHITSAYRLRARNPEFARAWDTARRMAYATLRDEAMDRALNGTPQQVWRKGVWVEMKRVYSDRLLIAMLNHLKHESSPRAMAPTEQDVIEDGRSNAAATVLARLADPEAPASNP
jgi:hypothetical protein